MTFNLIHEAWLPVRRASDERLWIKPADITSYLSGDPIVALDFPRPDWNAAIKEFLIGSFTCALAPEDEKKWRHYWQEPPSPKSLSEKLERIAFAFNLDSDGPRTFQDLDPLLDAEEKEIAQLLIDAPGAIALTKNTDHFVKRAATPALCVPYAAAALITLQTYAPAGGAGHRTSLRGGGPLTTLAEPAASARADKSITSIWYRIWANAPILHAGEQPPFHLPSDHPAWARIFPWLAATKTSDGKKVVGPDGGNSILMPFFAAPRRIRLMYEKEGDCALGGHAKGFVVRSYRTKNYGADYEGWRHPLSPYRDDKQAGYPLPLHPALGVASYRDWLGIWGAREGQYQAECLVAWTNRANRLPEFKKGSRHIANAFGFDMDSMKPLAWIESRAPFYAIDDAKTRDEFYRIVRNLIDGAETAARSLRYQIKIALFGVEDRDGNYKLLDTSNTDETGREQAERFWRETEGDFRETLDQLVEMEDPSDESHEIRRKWLQIIKRAALGVFDDDISPEMPGMTIRGGSSMRGTISPPLLMQTTRSGRRSAFRLPSNPRSRREKALALEHAHDV